MEAGWNAHETTKQDDNSGMVPGGFLHYVLLDKAQESAAG
jgi:hypothetical protein